MPIALHAASAGCNLFLGIFLARAFCSLVASIFKDAYKRYTVQIPDALAEELEQISKATKKSVSLIVLEWAERGHSLPSDAEIQQMQRDQLTLLKAGPLALSVLYGAGEKKAEAAQALADLIAGSVVRQQVLAAAEDPAPYHAAPPHPQEAPQKKAAPVRGQRPGAA